MKAIPLAQVLTIMKPIYTFLLLPALALCVAGLRAEVPASPATGGLSVADLRCEYRTNPMVIDAARPRLSWTLASPVRGARQSAYQILVASSALVLAADEGDWWDSGKVASDESTQIEYAGNPLASGANCFWKVRAWDASGQAGAWSATARWTMGLLKPEYWRASWIRADLGNEVSPWFRKTFMLDSAPPRVIAYVNAIGYFELYVNGRRVGAEVLAPAVSDTRVQSLYVAYDIGPLVLRGVDQQSGLIKRLAPGDR